jgi:hypothetical protein
MKPPQALSCNIHQTEEEAEYGCFHVEAFAAKVEDQERIWYLSNRDILVIPKSAVKFQYLYLIRIWKIHHQSCRTPDCCQGGTGMSVRHRLAAHVKIYSLRKLNRRFTQAVGSEGEELFGGMDCAEAYDALCITVFSPVATMTQGTFRQIFKDDHQCKYSMHRIFWQNLATVA